MALAMDIIKLPIVRDHEIVTNQPHSNWQRNQLMFLAKDRCRMIETMGGAMSATAVSYHLRDATPTEMAKGLGTAFLATKYGCPEYRTFFEPDYADIVLNIDGWEVKEINQVLNRP